MALSLFLTFDLVACRFPLAQEEAFRNALDEIHLQHDRLAEVYAAVRDRSATSGPSSGDTGPSSQSQSQGGWEGTEAEATELMVYHAGILRNKRLLFAYVRARLERIEELRWTRRALPPEVSANLTPAEERYFRSYDRLLSKYMRSGRLGVGVDLTADPLPPEDPFVHVRVLRDYGEVVFSSGKARSMVPKGESELPTARKSAVLPTPWPWLAGSRAMDVAETCCTVSRRLWHLLLV